MNNSKIWLVVNPTVGIPIFLGAVAVGSFSVHVAVLSNTTWVSDFLSGRELGSGAAESAAVIENDAIAPARVVIPGGAAPAAEMQEVIITLPDGTQTPAILDRRLISAMSGAPTARTAEH